MAGRTISVGLAGPANTVKFLVPAALVPFVDAVNVQVDNSAGADSTAVLSILSPQNTPIADKAQQRAIAGGDLDRATWAVGLADEPAKGFGILPWWAGVSFSQKGGGTTVGPGASSRSRFDGFIQNNDPTTFDTQNFGDPFPVGFIPLKPGVYIVWIASQWDVAAFDKQLGFVTPLTDSLFNGRNSNSAAVQTMLMLNGLNTLTTLFCTNKNNDGVAHDVTVSYMSAVYLGGT